MQKTGFYKILIGAGPITRGKYLANYLMKAAVLRPKSLRTTWHETE